MSQIGDCMAEIESRTEELVMPIIEPLGFSLYDIEYVKEGDTKVLRVYIDREGGITSDETADVCRKLSDRIDEESRFINEPYTLEVSSPGLTRPLTKPKHFLASIGKDVEFKLFSPVSYEENGKTYTAKEFIGILKGYNEADDTVLFGFEDREMTCSRRDISSIKLWIDF